jgi:hypothetical protein
LVRILACDQIAWNYLPFWLTGAAGVKKSIGLVHSESGYEDSGLEGGCSQSAGSNRSDRIWTSIEASDYNAGAP